MKLKPLIIFLPILFAGIGILASCDDFIEPSINKSQVQLEAPADHYLSSTYTINFWWDPVDHALSYHLQVVSPNFTAPGSLVLDTIVNNNKFSFNLSPGIYQWRVMAENGSSQTVFTSPRNLTVATSSIKLQAVQLSAPANNLLTNQSSVVLQWGSLYGATQYQLQIDTDSFADTTVLVYNKTISSQQVTFTFPKDQVYQWRVRGENDTAYSQWSATNTMTYDHTPPPQVSLVSPAKGGTLSLPVSLQWNAAATTVSYKLYVFQSDSTTSYNANFPMIINTTSYNFNLGNSGDRVYWKVSAVDAAGNEGEASPLSNFVLQ